MKTKKQTKPTSKAASLRSLTGRAAGAVLAFGTAATNQPDVIRPFHLHASDKDLADLVRRFMSNK